GAGPGRRTGSRPGTAATPGRAAAGTVGGPTTGGAPGGGPAPAPGPTAEGGGPPPPPPPATPPAPPGARPQPPRARGYRRVTSAAPTRGAASPRPAGTMRAPAEKDRRARASSSAWAAVKKSSP